MERHLKNRTMLMPVLEEYTKRNNIVEYDFVLMVEYHYGSMFNKKITGEKLFLHMIDTNDKETLQFEEIDQQGINGIVLHEEHIIPIATRLIRQQKLKELGI